LPTPRFVNEEPVSNQPDGGRGQRTGFHSGSAYVGGRDANEVPAKHQNQATNVRRSYPTAFGRRACILVRGHEPGSRRKIGVLVRSEAYDAFAPLSKSNALLREINRAAQVK
jgi:hypothetical protein